MEKCRIGKTTFQRSKDKDGNFMPWKKTEWMSISEAKRANGKNSTTRKSAREIPGWIPA